MGPSPIVLFLSPGRCGTGFLYNSFRKAYPKLAENGHFYHESLTVKESIPRRFFRPYEPERQQRLRERPPVRDQVDRWHDQLERGPVIEFGWSVSHLAPLLRSEFGDRLRIVHLYRHPVIYAGSRASMGNYAGRYGAQEAYAVSPFDEHAINTQFRDRWEDMVPFERCLFFWLEYYDMAVEFRERHPETRAMTLASETLFEEPRPNLRHIARFAGLEERTMDPEVNKNSILKRHVEHYPVGEEWTRFRRHPEILKTMEELGYTRDEDELAPRMTRYQLPDNFMSKLRYYLGYWPLKSRVKDLLPGF